MTIVLHRKWPIAGMAAVLLVAGCGSGGGTGSSAMSTADYQALITGVEQSAKPLLDKISAAGSMADLAAAREELAKALEAKKPEVDKAVPPADAQSAHVRMTKFTNLGKALRTAPAPDTKPNECGVVPGEDLQLAKAKLHMRETVGAVLSGADGDFTKAKLKLADLVPANVTLPEKQSRQAKNGEVVHRSGPKGNRKLTVKNGDKSDVAVSVVIGDPKNPRATMYVRGNSDAVLTGLSGTYQVYYKSGADWDSARRGFTRDCAFSKFDESFTSDGNWEISLTPSVGGNASTSDVPAF